MDRDKRGRFLPGNSLASIGGKARAAALSPARRQEIARLGLVGLAKSRFNGDVKAARQYLVEKGLAALDAHYAPEMRKWHDPDEEIF